MAVRNRKALALSKDLLQRAFSSLLFLALLYLSGFPMFTPAQVSFKKLFFPLRFSCHDCLPVSTFRQR
jgi:hypothetical protein